MINKITIKNIATLKGVEQKAEELKKFNYFFGANGTGKTTVGNIISNATPFDTCSIKWANDNILETRVYNLNFVENNFSEQLKGVFTLGKESKETQDKIKEKNDQVTVLQGQIDNFNATLKGRDGHGGKQSELVSLESEYADKFWMQKTKADKSPIKKGMKGVLDDKKKFKQKVLDELANAEAVLALSELEEKAKTVFDDSLTEIAEIIVPEVLKIEQLENDTILKKIIVGKSDVDIAGMIKSLGNSDWVKQGKSYFERNNGICPFCQQKTSEEFKKNLEAYFDKVFEEDATKITDLIANYNTQALIIEKSLQSILDNHSLINFLDTEQLKAKLQVFSTTTAANKQKIEQKQKEASQVVVLASTKTVIIEMLELIAKGNKKIEENNTICKNLDQEKRLLTKQIWRYIVSELKTDIESYWSKKNGIEVAITNLRNQIVSKEKEKLDAVKDIKDLEKKITSIQPTCDGINKLLASFGFTSFKLVVAIDGRSYKIVRDDGTDAKKTLSEGERNFVTFLYFYHLLKGSHSETGTTISKVVVIDDPVSSLDNDVLFIVSTLVRELIAQARGDSSDIKQVFILTHNIYFHKEVTYNSRRGNHALNEETFFIIKKRDNVSILEKTEGNPIKTSYELLWSEIANTDCNHATIQNTMRRILENYFKMLGNISFDDLIDKFEGDDKLKCKALLSWVNDGSHSALDEDYYTPLTTTEVLRFKKIFKQIFEKSNHFEHYKMMVRSDINLTEEGRG